MKARSAFSIQRDVIFAIFVREMITRFSNYTFGNIWLLLEPLLMMALFIGLFGLRGRGAYGFAEAPVFIFSSFLAFRLLWQSTMRQCSSARTAAKSMLEYRQVRLFDIFLARSIIEGGIYIIVGSLIAIGLFWFGIDPWPADPLLVVVYSFFMWLLATGVGMLACMLSSIAREVEKLISMSMMPLLFLSAVLFPASAVPPHLLPYLDWNPVLHAMELIREAWFETYISPVADFKYLASFTLVVLAVALSSYRLNWRRIIAQ
jgi:capsular polysaccharide transport system permease protein